MVDDTAKLVSLLRAEVNFPMLLAARLVMSLGTGISLPLITNIHWHDEA